MKFAVQLYAMRDYIAEHGVESAFGIISRAGFEGVEFAGFYGMTAEQISALLGKYGLKAVSAHVGCGAAEEQAPILKALGITCSVVPWMGFNSDMPYEEGKSTLEETAAALKKHGLGIGYHNHAHEFKDGADIVSRLSEDIPELLLEPDVFWLAVAGVNAVEFINKHRARVGYLHVKELGEGGAEDFNPVLGEGKANLGEVLALGKSLGIEWAILELEKISVPIDEYLRRSYAFMKNYR